jgi:hypothetical protein
MKRFRRWIFTLVGAALLAGVLLIGTTQQNYGQSAGSDRLMVEREIKIAIATHDAEIKKQVADLQGQIMVMNRKLDEIKKLLMPEEGAESSIPKKK